MPKLKNAMLGVLDLVPQLVAQLGTTLFVPSQVRESMRRTGPDPVRFPECPQQLPLDEEEDFRVWTNDHFHNSRRDPLDVFTERLSRKTASSLGKERFNTTQENVHTKPNPFVQLSVAINKAMAETSPHAFFLTGHGRLDEDQTPSRMARRESPLVAHREQGASRAGDWQSIDI